MRDRTTKLLLTLIAIALWGLLLRPAFTPVPSHAAEPPRFPPGPSARFTNPIMKIVQHEQHIVAVYVIDNGGWVYRLDPSTLQIQRSVRLEPKP